MKPKAAIALSGGIDSLVAAYLIIKQYPSSIGLYFTTGYEDKKINLEKIEDQLGILIKHVDLSLVFEKKIVNYFINTYLEGKTPNPCIWCNKLIKFGALLEYSRSLGADFLATGHYANIEKNENSLILKKGLDPYKEQSYFLSLLSENELKDVLFPLGDMTKENVKILAEKAGLTPVEEKESQDICFLKNTSIARFIEKKTNQKLTNGSIVNTEGKIIGTHNGLCNFTIGQRRGINCPSSEPYYVKSIDVKNNTLMVCHKKNLFLKKFKVSSLNFIAGNLKFPLKVITKIRYNQKGSSAVIDYKTGSDTADVTFQEKQFAITPGQTAVFYQEQKVIGSGVIL